MSSSETIDNAIRFARSLEAAVGDLCDNCKQRIRQELNSQGVGRSTSSNQRSRPEQVTGTGVFVNYDR